MQELSDHGATRSRRARTKLTMSAMVVVLLATLLSLSATAAPASAGSSECHRLGQSPFSALLHSPHPDCHYVVMKAYGNWGKLCEGKQVNSGCTIPYDKPVKIDVYSKKTWKLVDAYRLTIRCCFRPR